MPCAAAVAACATVVGRETGVRRVPGGMARVGRCAGAAESETLEPDAVPAGRLALAGALVTASEVSPDGAGIGSGIAAEADGEAVTSTGVASSLSGQFGLSSTAVVPRRKTTSVAASSGSVPFESPPSWSCAL
jgi:hypothetical protein